MVRLENLFSRKSRTKASSEDDGPNSQAGDFDDVSNRKAARQERRELLYAVVREAMAKLGILSTSYKFKVLSLDSQGSQYLIMMDLPKEMATQIHQMAEIESSIKENSRIRHRIDVNAVYWRFNDMGPGAARPAAASRSREDVNLDDLLAPTAMPVLKPAAPQARPPQRQEVQPGASKTPPEPGRRFAPIRSDEVQAFKQGGAGANKPKADPAAPRPSKPGNGFAPTQFAPSEFEPTRFMEEDDRNPLSRTQYGDLI